MLLVPKISKFAWSYDNWGASHSTSSGTSVTPGASNVWGSWVEIGPDASITTDVWLMEVGVTGGATSGQDKSQLLDIGIDPSGGTTYVSIFGDTATAGQAATKGIVCGSSAGIGTQGPDQTFVLPIRIPSGAAIAVRVQGSNATAGTVRITGKWWGKPSCPEVVWRGQAAEIVGTITNSGGVSFTPGNASNGSWTSLGTTTRANKWWQLGVQCSNNTTGGAYYYFDLAYGDGSNYVQILRATYFTNTSEFLRRSFSMGSAVESFCEVPAGATLYVRGRCGASPDSGWNAVAVGVS